MERSGVWPDLEEQIAEPVGIELTASGAFLHALYSGIENIYRRIAIELDGGLPRGGDWHRQLLRSMTRPTEARPWAISDVLHDRLLGYLDFRHLFRNVYVFRLEWERMAELVLNAEAVVEELNRQLDSFIRRMDETTASRR